MDSVKVAAFDIGGTFVKCAKVEVNVKDFTFKVTEYKKIRSTVMFLGEVEVLIDKWKSDVDVVSFSVAGAVRDPKGVVFLPNMGLRVNFYEFAQKVAPGHQVFILNDADAAAIACWQEAEKLGVSNYATVVLGTGVGAGIIHGKKLLSTGAGEIGHIVVEKNGSNCSCGGKGCLETVCSTRFLEREAFARFGVRLTPKELFESDMAYNLANEMEKILDDNVLISPYELKRRLTVNRLASIILKYIENLAIAMASTVNLLALEAVFLAGGIARGVKKFEKLLKYFISKRLYSGFSPIIKFMENAELPLQGAALYPAVLKVEQGE